MTTGFVKNAHRVDPYKTYKFRILWDGKPVLGVSKVGQLRRTTNVVPYRSGGENSTDHKHPGRTQYEGLTLERGITHDPEFEKWANLAHPYAGDAAMDLVHFKKELTLEVMNENAIAVETIKLELDGWERDVGTSEPEEATAPAFA